MTDITFKAKRRRRTKAEIAEAAARAELDAKMAGLHAAAKKYLLRTTPGQRYIAERRIRGWSRYSK